MKETILPIEEWPESHKMAVTEIVENIVDSDKFDRFMVTDIAVENEGKVDSWLVGRFEMRNYEEGDEYKTTQLFTNITDSYEIPLRAMNATYTELYPLVGEVVLFDRQEYEASLK